MFGTSGIRGLYGKEVTESLAIKVANAFSDRDIAIGRDIRRTGVPLSMAAASGALAAGKDVIRLGIVPTPTVALATKKHSCNGIMITASHNPGEYNGMKLISETKEIDKAYEKKVSERCTQELRLSEWDKVGKTSDDNEIIKNHIDLVLEQVDTTLIKSRKPKVVVDCNGAGAVITPMLMRDLGCEVSVMNDSLEGFSRPSEPNEKNLQGLIERMRSEKADMGIAHDGDADRTVIVDDLGNVLPLDVQLAMMIEHELERSDNKKIISTMEASLAIREVVQNAGGSIDITPVGSTYVSEELEKLGALFGGEPCGEYIYEKGVHVPDAMLASAKFVELFCMKGRFSEQREKYHQYSMAREKLQAANKYDAV
ncbi:TPA: hypothetical protein EYP38_01065, partial [Candidatus Micrarchaeota archaeon]|nr:hypothetical protein [Candidatus Micrarchaeota archaeon]